MSDDACSSLGFLGNMLFNALMGALMLLGLMLVIAGVGSLWFEIWALFQ